MGVDILILIILYMRKDRKKNPTLFLITRDLLHATLKSYTHYTRMCVCVILIVLLHFEKYNIITQDV